MNMISLMASKQAKNDLRNGSSDRLTHFSSISPSSASSLLIPSSPSVAPIAPSLVSASVSVDILGAETPAFSSPHSILSLISVADADRRLEPVSGDHSTSRRETQVAPLGEATPASSFQVALIQRKMDIEALQRQLKAAIQSHQVAFVR